MKMRIAGLAAVVASALTLACSSWFGGEPMLVARSGLAMGSSVTLMAWTPDQDLANRSFDAAFAEFQRLEGLLSTWKPESDISKLNAAAGNHPVKMSADTLKVLFEARDVSDL
ncbi:MAG: FAD:protein FMN transferase, partial [Vicinamibacterales bacterium]